MQKNSRKNDRPPHWQTLPRVFSGLRSRDKLENDFLRGYNVVLICPEATISLENEIVGFIILYMAYKCI
jgi:hypothetical protein